MNLLNIKLGKVSLTDLVNRFANIVPSAKDKNEENNIDIYLNSPLLEKMEKGLRDEERLSPFDSKCNQELIAKVTKVFSDYGVDKSGEQYTIEQHETVYIDGTSKIFEVCTSASGISITEVDAPKVK